MNSQCRNRLVAWGFSFGIVIYAGMAMFGTGVASATLSHADGSDRGTAGSGRSRLPGRR